MKTAHWKFFNGRLDFIFVCLLILIFIIDNRIDLFAGMKDAISFLLR